ncbi:hypothetical protein [Acinetobacter pittii]|uniref:hypothetical protein n=1 Tax=Acinetobacter pittii TaxID=48296 RepID=UPI0025B180B7|nr:hypothetical protein [Acinetobacter pittii]
MLKARFYKIFFSFLVSFITIFYFHLIGEFFVEVLRVFQPENKYVVVFIILLSLFLRNRVFKKLFKQRIREACLINFMTYRLNFEIYRFK